MRHHTTTRRAGMSTMEFALILPFFFILVLGIIETGNIALAWLTVQKAAESGARVATTGQGVEEGNRLTLIEEATEKWLVDLNRGTKEITISSWPTAAATGDPVDGNAGGPCQLVQVAVIYHYHPLTPLLGDMLPDSIPLQGKDRKLNEPWRPCDD